MSSNRAISPWRRFAIRLMAMCVLGLLAGAAWIVMKPPIDRELTSYGLRVSNASQLLGAVEHSMDAEVRARHGSRSPKARCYYATDPGNSRPSATGLSSAGSRSTGTGSSGADSSGAGSNGAGSNGAGSNGAGSGGGDLPVPISDRMFCGPVLFIDGDPSRPFLTYNLVSTPGAQPGTVKLAINNADGDPDGADPRPASQLIRPDNKQPPVSDQLALPQPPAAVGDVLTTTSTLRTPITAAGPDAQMVGLSSGVRLVEYGFVDSYGWGDRTRTAPSGYRLLAFAVEPVAGEFGNSMPDLSVRISGLERGPLAATSDYLVTAVPKHASSVDLVLTDSGVKQSISLLTGEPAGTNPQVTRRQHTSQTLSVSRAVRVQLKTAKGTGQLTGTLSVRTLSLTYWAADGSHCSATDRAMLHIVATVKLDGDRQPYGAEAGLISLTLPESGRLTARNAAGDPTMQVDDVIEVPSSITTGQLSYSGTLKTSKATITVLTPVTVPFDIPAD